jgi:tripartite-type tricarboxylate transporter receptor subunit TctC
MSAVLPMRLLILASLAPLLVASIAQADGVSDFYAGKSITLIISTGVGGGVDTNARLLAKYLGNHIPGKPTIVPKNMTGAGHLQAANYVYVQAPKDGTVIGAILPTFLGYQVLDGRGAQYDVRNFNFLGSSDVENANLYTWHTLGIKKIEQVKTREVLMGSTGVGSYTRLFPTLLNHVLGYRFKIVSGYKSTTEIHLAMERGEVSGRAGNFFTSLKSQNPDWLTDKKIDMLLQFGAVRDPEWPDLPLLTDLATNDEQRQIFKLFCAELALGRVFVTTPRVPADRLNALRKAFDETVHDPAFIADAVRLEMQVRPLDHHGAKQLADEIAGMPKDLVDKAKAAIDLL